MELYNLMDEISAAKYQYCLLPSVNRYDSSHKFRSLIPCTCSPLLMLSRIECITINEDEIKLTLQVPTFGFYKYVYMCLCWKYLQTFKENAVQAVSLRFYPKLHSPPERIALSPESRCMIKIFIRGKGWWMGRG